MESKFEEANLTYEQEVIINLWQINKSIKYGVGLIVGFILSIIVVITSYQYPVIRFMFYILSVLLQWVLFITIIYAMSRDKKYLKSKLEEWKNE